MKKLVVCNIVMLLLAIGGFLSLLLAPLVSFNVGQMMSGLVENIPEDGSSDLNIGQDEKDMMKSMSTLLDSDITFSTLKFGNIAVAEDPGATFLTQFFLYKGGPVETILLGAVSSAVISQVDVPEDKLGNVDYKELTEALQALEEEGADVDQVVQDYMDKIKAQLGNDVFGESEEDIKNTVTDLVNGVKDNLDGTYSTETLVCVLLSKGAKDINNLDVENYDGPTTYEELAKQLSEGKLELGGEDEGGNSEDPTAFLSEMIGTVAEYGSYIGYAFYGMLVLLLPWMLFIILCTLHIFIRNKRAATWYLFTFGCIPCIIFWLLPLILKLALGSLLGEMGAMIAAVLGSIGSLAWISGLFLVVMWVLWLFWMRPLKKRAKIERRAEKAAERADD